MTGKHAWGAIGLGVLAWELYAANTDEKLLSEVVDEWIISHPLVTYGSIVLLATHLANVWDAAGAKNLDPIHVIAKSFGYTKRRKTLVPA